MSEQKKEWDPLFTPSVLANIRIVRAFLLGCAPVVAVAYGFFYVAMELSGRSEELRAGYLTESLVLGVICGAIAAAAEAFYGRTNA